MNCDFVLVDVRTSLQRVRDELVAARRKVSELERCETVLTSTEYLFEVLLMALAKECGWRVNHNTLFGWFCITGQCPYESYLRADLKVYSNSPTFFASKIDAMKLLALYLTAS